MRSWRDLEVGDRERLGPAVVLRAEAVAFASRYDPQPFLLSEAGAAGNPLFRAMAVSGWLVAALLMRLVVEEGKRNPVAMVGAPGVDRLRWRHPVYPGDRLWLETEVVAKRLLASRPGIGLITKRWRARNQHGALVLTALTQEFVAHEVAAADRRHAWAPAH